jgi:hypothetical protein
MTVRKRTKLPRSRGEFGFSVPEAGAMIGLSVNPSYEAARRGEIPTVKIGGLLIVPKALWLRKLGVEATDARQAGEVA